MKHRTGFLLAVVLALLLTGAGMRPAIAQGDHAAARGWASLVRGGLAIAERVNAVIGALGTVRLESRDKPCGNITCQPNELCCFDCFGNPVCTPRRMGQCHLIPCPPPSP